MRLSIKGNTSPFAVNSSSSFVTSVISSSVIIKSLQSVHATGFCCFTLNMAEEQNKINTNKNSEEGTDKSNKEDNIDHEPSEESTRKDNMETDRDANDSNAENEEMSDSKLEEPADGNETQEGNDEEGEDEEKVA